MEECSIVTKLVGFCEEVVRQKLRQRYGNGSLMVASYWQLLLQLIDLNGFSQDLALKSDAPSRLPLGNHFCLSRKTTFMLVWSCPFIDLWS